MGCDSVTEKHHEYNQKKNITLSETDKAILECKTCRDNIKKYIRNLENKEAKAREKAKSLLKKKDKDRARLYLRQCKLFSEQTKVADAQLSMVNEQIINIQRTQSMQECMQCLQQGNQVLKQLQSEVSIEHWENIRDDMEELKDRDREIGDFFKERGYEEGQYEAECEEELNRLMVEVNGADSLPNVPDTKLNEDENKVKKSKAKVKKKKKAIES